MIHAPDPVGKAAHRCAMLVTKQDFRLLTAASAELTPAERREALVHFAKVHRAYCRAVSDLEAIAKASFAEGYALDEQAQEHIEGRAHVQP